MNRWEKEVQQSLLDSEEAAIKELETQYKRALNDINAKVKQFQTDIDLLDEALSQDGLDDATKTLLQSQKRSKIYQQQYQEALKGQVSAIVDKLHGDSYATIDKYLNSCYETGYVGTMYDIAKQGIPIITPINQAEAVKAVLTDSKVVEGYYNHLGVNYSKLKKTITQEISRGIASSLPYRDIARNINNASQSGLSNAKRIARTEGHRIQQTSTRDAQLAAKAKGADVVKQWDAALDGRTRDSHARVDGEIRELDEKFSNGLMFPGDPSGRPEEVINCRCTSDTRVRWALDESELQALQERAEYFGLDKTENFAEFKEKYLTAVENSGNDSTIRAGSSVDKFDRKARIYDADEDLAAVNPNFSTGEYQWTHNCQRCVSTYEMRRRGYKVTAKPCPGRLEDDDLAAWFEAAWNGADRKWCMSGSGKKQVEAFMSEWGDGSRAVVGVGFDATSGHVFFAERVNGKTVYFDPQNPTANCLEYFKRACKGRTHVTRLDNLQPSDRIVDCCKSGDG